MRPTIEHGFDRIKVWLDQTEYPGCLDDLTPHCRGVEFTCGQMLYNAQWKSAIELFQPTQTGLRVLQHALQDSSVAQQPSETEIVIDLIPNAAHRHLAKKLERAFVTVAVPKYHRREALYEKGTWYFERRTGPNGSPREHVLTTYADRPSKLSNRHIRDGDPPCLHIEWRVTGVAAMQKLGLFTVDDLIAFQHKKFWPKHVYLHALPRKTDLGRLLARAKHASNEVSGTALRRRADRWLQQYATPTVKGRSQFVLYNALRGTKRRLLERHRVTFKQWLHDALKSSQALR
jgi:hypothetical protein